MEAPIHNTLPCLGSKPQITLVLRTVVCIYIKNVFFLFFCFVCLFVFGTRLLC